MTAIVADLDRWQLPTEWVDEWIAKGYGLERLEVYWARYRDLEKGNRRSVAYIRSGVLNWHEWEAKRLRQASVTGANAQRGGASGPSSSPNGKNGELHVDARTRAAAAEMGEDVGRLAKAFVDSGMADRCGTRASEVFKRQVEDEAQRRREQSAIPAADMQRMIEDELRKLRGAAA